MSDEQSAKKTKTSESKDKDQKAEKIEIKEEKKESKETKEKENKESKEEKKNPNKNPSLSLLMIQRKILLFCYHRKRLSLKFRGRQRFSHR